MQPTHTYNKYTITNVYGTVTPEQSQRIINFWQRNNAIGNPQEVRQRVHQVVLMAEDADSQVVGVSTVYPHTFIVNMKNFFYYRMFIQPSDRVFGMMSSMTGDTYEFLKNHSMPNKPAGLVLVTENKKLMRKGMRKVIKGLGFVYIGEDNQQQDVWLGKFEE